MNRIALIAASVAASLAFAGPTFAMNINDYMTELGGYSSAGMPENQFFKVVDGERTDTVNTTSRVGTTPSRTGMEIEHGSVLSCPWPKTSRYYPGYKKNVNPITCQIESLVHDDGGHPIYRTTTSTVTVQTKTTVVVQSGYDPEIGFEDGWSITPVSETTEDCPCD